jgi:hypothetical protein
VFAKAPPVRSGFAGAQVDLGGERAWGRAA